MVTGRSWLWLTAMATIVASPALLAACSDDAETTATTQPGGDAVTDGGDEPAGTDGVGSDDGGDSGTEDLGDPVDLRSATDFGNGVGIRLAEIESVTVEGRIPGETSGPGVAITVEITNGSDTPIDLDAVTVDLTDSEGASASPVTPPEPQALSGALPVGESTTGRYLFTFPIDDRSNATVRVSYTTSAPTILFTGSLPDA